MHSDAETQLPGTAAPRGRGATLAVARSAFLSLVLLTAYFALPLTGVTSAQALVRLTLGLLVVSLVLAWQVREIVRSPYPRARAVGALLVSVPLFLVLFAATYYVMGRLEPSSWSEPMTRLDALYFTLTVFATVGFGDITATTQVARAVTSVQMVGNLVFVGVIARVVVGAMQEGLRRRSSPPPP